MRKGITPIIAEILLLLMTVALAGSAWLFFSGQFGSLTSKMIEASPLAASENSVLVFNRGTQAIKADELVITVDGSDALIVNPQQIAAGGNAIIYFVPRIAISPDVWEIGPFNSNAEVRVRSPTNAVSYRTELSESTVHNLVRNSGFEEGVNVGWIPISTLFNNHTSSPLTGSISANATGWIGAIYSSDYIPYDPGMKLNIELYAKSNGIAPDLSLLYAGFIEWDKDKNIIDPAHVYYRENTKTFLQQDLNPGDDHVHLTSGANWYNDPNPLIWYYRVIGFWNTGDYPPYTYTRTLGYYSGVIGNTLTLCSQVACSVPSSWTGSMIPAGTPVANMFYGSSYNYVAAVEVPVPTTWTRYSGSVTGWAYGQNTGTGNLRYGTEYVTALILANIGQDVTHMTLLDDFRVWVG